jgi:ribonuclease T1
MRALVALGLACVVALAWGFSGLPTEARETLERIEAGGPFPYKQDGRVFHNRERLLPAKERGYYREYTVRTPGARDRGARRIVAGRNGEYYYTEDHYRSFRRISR